VFIWGRFWGDNGFFDLSGTALSLFQGISVGANSVGGGELFELNSNKDNAIGIFNSRFNSHTNCYHIKLTYNSSSNLYDAEIIDSEIIFDNNSSNYYHRRYYLDLEDNLRAYNPNSSNSLYSYYDFSRNKEVVDINLTNNLTSLGFNDKYIEEIYDTKYFGQLVAIDQSNGTKFISNVQDPDGNCQIILSVDNTSSNNIYFDEYISEDSSGYLYALSEERTYDSNFNIENVNHILYKFDSRTNAVETLSVNDEDAFVRDEWYRYFLWTDNDGDSWLVQNIDEKISGTLSQENYKAWQINNQFTSITKEPEVICSFVEDDLINRRNDTAFATTYTKGEAAGFVIASSQEDIDYEKNIVYTIEDAINKANIFDPWSYLASHNDLINAFGTDTELAISHYQNHGKKEGRHKASFKPAVYLEKYADLGAVFGTDLAAATQHYVAYGYAEGRTDSISNSGGSNDDSSDAFTEAQALSYIASNPDLINAFGIDTSSAISHYTNYGQSEGRSIDTFNATNYLTNYADLAAAFGSNTVAATRHYITNGYAEGRTDSSSGSSGSSNLTEFQALNYIASNNDLISAFGTNTEAAKSHYTNHGKSEGRTLDDFDEWGYLASNNDLMNAFGSDSTKAIKHFISYGNSEGRVTNLFNATSYLNNYADLKNAFGNDKELATKHYVEYGFNEGRSI